MEVKGKNKRSPYLIGFVYQPNSENAKNIEWIDKTDPVVSSIKSTRESSIILTDNTNIDLWHVQTNA